MYNAYLFTWYTILLQVLEKVYLTFRNYVNHHLIKMIKLIISEAHTMLVSINMTISKETRMDND